jgi:DNA-binding transcriptional ArsR family regulator
VQEGLDAIAHPGRRAMLTLLLGGERSAGELAAHAGMRQPVASQHLRVLREAGLVTVRKDGNRRVYSVDFENVARLQSELDAFWKPALGALKDTAEAAARAAGEPTAVDPAGGSRTRPPQARRGGGGG